MAKILLGALALAALPSAFAFRNTSPLFVFSTADLNLPSTSASIGESSQNTADILEALRDCPTRSYLVIQQAGVSSADYADGRSAPQLSRYMSGKSEGVKTTFAVPEIVGQVDGAAIVSHLESKCGYHGKLNRIVAPVADKVLRVGGLLQADDILETWIAGTEFDDYTVIYTTTPPNESTLKAQLVEENPPYEMESSFGESMQMELKRDLSSHDKRANSTSSAGLFERYQYFTPGLFMGFAAIIPLFLILLVGIRALTSLEVSYFAFSKEMGPNAQKKQ